MRRSTDCEDGGTERDGGHGGRRAGELAVGPAARPLPSCLGRRGGGVTTGRRVQGSLVPKPRPGASTLQTQTPHVERGARGQQVLCLSPHRGKASPAARWEDRLCGEGSTGATEDTGFPSSGAGGSTPGLSQGPPRDSPRGHALGGTCPENPGPWRKEGRTLRTLLLPPGYKATRHHGTQGSRKGPRSSLCTPNTGRA